MSWDIRVWHEDIGERTRLTIEAGIEVPGDVIAAIAGSYWEEEVQYVDEWAEGDDYEGGLPGPGSGFHG